MDENSDNRKQDLSVNPDVNMESNTNSTDDQDSGITLERGVYPIRIEDEMQTSYIDYSMSVIVGRALPDARDGLKPVHRRCLYTMSELNNTYTQPHKKSARIVGDVMGKYHPHGDASIYDTIVRMAQPFSMRYTLVNGHGNFGSIDGDGAAAMRYTEVRMERLAEAMLEDLEKETVDMGPNYDESLVQPLVLPSKVPNLLLNGSTGIAVGMATNMPPHNLNEICEAIIHMVDNPMCTIDDLMQFIKGPDFPTAGIICGVRPIELMYKTGRGAMQVRGCAEVVEEGNNSRIIITELPYGVNKASMIERIANLVKEKIIDGIRDIRDESKEDIRVVIELKRDAMPQVVLNQLYKHTQLQTTFGAIMLALDRGRPKVMNLKQLMRCFIDHRIDVITRRTKFELRKAEERCHILEGFRIAIDNMDEIVRIIRSSADDAEARSRMMEKFGLSELQCTAILDMRLRQLTGLARDRVEAEYQAILLRIADYKDILANPQRILDIIKTDCTELMQRYGDERRTQITYAEGDVNIEDIIPNEPCIVTLSNRGYIKRVSLTEFEEQRRGGKGKRGARLKDGDFVMNLFTPMTHDRLLFFTSHGRVFTEKAYSIPEAERTSFGRPLVNLLMLRPEITQERAAEINEQSGLGKFPENGSAGAGLVEARSVERVLGIISIKDFDEDKCIFFATSKGYVKRTHLNDYRNVNKSGIRAIRIDDDDELVGVELMEDGDEMILVSASGQTVRFKAGDVRVMGRTARGVRGIRLAGVTMSAGADRDDEGTDADESDSSASTSTDLSESRDELRALVKVSDDPNSRLLMLVENGFGTCSRFSDYPVHRRGGKGVKSISTGDRNGKLVFAAPVLRASADNEDSIEKGDSLLVITELGQMIRIGVDSIRETRRVAKGVKVVNVAEGDKVVSATVITEDDDEDEEVAEGPADPGQ
jgi:DNA gyrase subunit A